MGSRGGRVPASRRKADKRKGSLENELRLTGSRISLLEQQGGQIEKQILALQEEKRRNEDAIQQMVGRMRLVRELLGLDGPMIDTQQIANGDEPEPTEEGEPEEEPSVDASNSQ